MLLLKLHFVTLPWLLFTCQMAAFLTHSWFPVGGQTATSKSRFCPFVLSVPCPQAHPLTHNLHTSPLLCECRPSMLPELTHKTAWRFRLNCFLQKKTPHKFLSHVSSSVLHIICLNHWVYTVCLLQTCCCDVKALDIRKSVKPWSFLSAFSVYYNASSRLLLTWDYAQMKQQTLFGNNFLSKNDAIS